MHFICTTSATIHIRNSIWFLCHSSIEITLLPFPHIKVNNKSVKITNLQYSRTNLSQFIIKVKVSSTCEIIRERERERGRGRVQTNLYFQISRITSLRIKIFWKFWKWWIKYGKQNIKEGDTKYPSVSEKIRFSETFLRYNTAFIQVSSMITHYTY